jgi:hypothetical protein
MPNLSGSNFGSIEICRSGNVLRDYHPPKFETLLGLPIPPHFRRRMACRIGDYVVFWQRP